MTSKGKSLILVTGATGAVGPRVVEALDQAGYAVRAFSLDPVPNTWPGAVEDIVIGDVCDPSAVLAAMHEVDAVIHLAALLHIVNPPEALRDHYRRINVGGTQTVVDAAIKRNIRRIILFSTIAVYGPSFGQIIDEDMRPQPDTFYAHTKLEAEEIVRMARNGAGEPMGTVLRLGAVYGSRIKGNYSQLVKALHRGWFVPIGRGENRRTLVYDKDVAKAAVLALQHPAAAGCLFNVTDGQYHALADIINTICSALGRTPPRLSLPYGPVRTIAGIMEDAARLLGLKSPIVRGTIDKYVEDIAVNGQLIQQKLGFRPVYDLASGWQDTIREMRKEGTLST